MVADVVADAQVSSTSTFLRQWMYTDLNQLGCVRLLNATGSIGCSSSAQSGVLYAVNSMSDVQAFTSQAPQSLGTAYIPVVPDVIASFQASGRVNGILVRADTPNTTDAIRNSGTVASHENTCPSCAYGLYANQSASQQYQWNPTGDGLMYNRWTIPIFAINNDTLKLGVDVPKLASMNAQSGYAAYPQYAIELDAFMQAADVGADACLRRQFCLPVGGFSVYSTPSNSFATSAVNKPVVVLTATLDGVSFFHDLAQGAGASVAGTIALMAVADALTKGSVSPAAFQKQLIYAFFNAESWGHSGSETFANDMTSFQCAVPPAQPAPAYCPYTQAACSNPCRLNTNLTTISIDSVAALIDMNHLGAVGARTNTVMGTFVHTLDNSTDNVALATMFSDAGQLTNQPRFAQRFVSAASAGAQSNVGLPPSPAMAFLKRRTIPAAVVSDFASQYTNKFYATDFDDYTAVTADLQNVINHVCYSATATAKAVYYLANSPGSGMPARRMNASDVPDAVQANCTMIEQLFDCFLHNVSCALMQPFVSFQSSSIGRPPTYSSVLQTGGQPQYNVQFVYEYMFNLTANQVGASCATASCPTGFSCKQNQCVASSTLYHFAYGPGLAFDVKKNTWFVADATKPHWVESNWNSLGIRVFQVDSYTTQIVELIVGIALTGLTVAATWAAKRWARKLKQD
ncbi:hypothetical protein RI367_002992 [Sorochytrium milnesiophthora]